MEDSQNSAPDAHETTKLGSSSTQRNDTQSVTKRLVFRLHVSNENLALTFAASKQN